MREESTSVRCFTYSIASNTCALCGGRLRNPGPPWRIGINVKNPSTDSFADGGQVVAAFKGFLIAKGVHPHSMVMNYRRKGTLSLRPAKQGLRVHTSNAVVR